MMLGTAIRNGQLKKLSGAELRVLLALLSFSDKEGETHPSVDTLCRVTGYTRKTVTRTTTSLHKGGYIIKDYEIVYGRRMARYLITAPNFGEVNIPLRTEDDDVTRMSHHTPNQRGDVTKMSHNGGSKLPTEVELETVDKNKVEVGSYDGNKPSPNVGSPTEAGLPEPDPLLITENGRHHSD